MQVNAEVMRLDLPAYIEWIEMKLVQKRAQCLDRLLGCITEAARFSARCFNGWLRRVGSAGQTDGDCKITGNRRRTKAHGSVPAMPAPFFAADAALFGIPTDNAIISGHQPRY
jgi:hypothetical protein